MRLREVIQRGLRSAQPAATTVDVGVLYCVSDEADIVERSNGTTWDAFGSVTPSGDLVVDTIAVGGTLVAQTVATFTGQYVSPLVDDGNSGTAKTIDWAAGNDHRLVLTGSPTLTFSNPVDGGRYVLLVATGAGSFDITWPATVKWPGGSPPTVTATASKVDLFTFMYTTADSAYIGSFNQGY